MGHFGVPAVVISVQRCDGTHIATDEDPGHMGTSEITPFYRRGPPTAFISPILNSQEFKFKEIRNESDSHEIDHYYNYDDTLTHICSRKS